MSHAAEYPESAVPGRASSTLTAENKISKAASTPIELYDLMLSFLNTENIEGYDGDQDRRNRIIVTNRHLGRLALVCRLWAHICQKKIFHVIILRSNNDFDKLLLLAKHPSSLISHYIVRLNLEIDPESGWAWMHTVCMTIQPRSCSPFPNYVGHDLLLQTDAGADILTDRIPLGVPSRPEMTQNITWLVLRNVHPAELTEIVHLARTLTSLEGITCVNVDILDGIEWSDEQSEFLALSTELGVPGHDRPKIQEVCFYQSNIAWGDCWSGSLLLCFMDGARSLCVDHLKEVAGLLYAWREIECALEPIPTKSVSIRHNWGYEFSLRKTESELISPSVWIATTESKEDHRYKIDTVVLCFSPDSGESMQPLEEMLERDSGLLELCERSICVYEVRQVTLGFRCRDDMSLFSKTIGVRLSEMLRLALLVDSATKVVYALEQHNPSSDVPWSWIACDPDVVNEDIGYTKSVPWDRLYSL